MNTSRVFLRKIKTFVRKPKVLLVKLLTFFSPLIKDRSYLKLLFYLKLGYKLDLKNPQTFNQKLNWMKLYYRKPLLSILSDKYSVKDYVKERIGEEYVVKNYGVWDTFEEIDFDQLPTKFVLKTTHDQGGVVVCHDKSSFAYEAAREKINKHLKKSLYFKFREWPYKNIKPRVIAEEFLTDNNQELNDYKFFCFNGKAKVMYIATDRSTGKVKFDFYDIDFNHLDLVQTYPKSGRNLDKPQNYELMVDLANKLSEGLPQVRIDFYNINGKILFGEYTFFHHGGLQPFYPQTWDYTFGSWIDLGLEKC